MTFKQKQKKKERNPNEHASQAMKQEISLLSALNASQEMVCTKTVEKLIWNKERKEDFLLLSLHVNFTRSRLTLVLLPRSIDDELDEWKCWQERMSGWSVTGWEPITGAQGCWEDVGLSHMIAWMKRPMAELMCRGLNENNWATTVRERESSYIQLHAGVQAYLRRMHPHTLVCTDSLIVMMMPPIAFRWLMSSVSFSTPFLFIPPSPSIHMLHFPHSLSRSLSHIHVVFLRARVRESRAASVVLSFLAAFYCLCLSYLQALLHKCSYVLSIRFYQPRGVYCAGRSLKVTAPHKLQLLKAIYWYTFHNYFATLTLTSFTVSMPEEVWWQIYEKIKDKKIQRISDGQFLLAVDEVYHLVILRTCCSEK